MAYDRYEKREDTMERIMKRLENVEDDKTLREIERLIGTWVAVRTEINKQKESRRP